ncbi:Protein of unknown function [Lactobacillus helveticus CIRM-BIA 951]|uniref:Uncharacterized protein n=2 Tax=Lactobacillus helveticus TaxID=1587 RepID=U6FEX8_LACHE|nr:Protein of unknown function [Lactobacillus helveticus CIRM-BIA 951]CDI61101.1 Protein of unknown function [Lactobacillus helveticus CIRM-BIA 104]
MYEESPVWGFFSLVNIYGSEE